MKNRFTYVIARNEAISSLKLMILLLFLFASYVSFATPQEQLKAANDSYSKGKYEEAIKQYQSILSEDNISTDIYYNLGNCYYKTEDVPNAILNYEKALKLKPDNEDVLFNLKMANKLTIDKVDRLPELFIGNAWRNLTTSKTVDSWAYYAIGLIFLSLLFFISYLLMQQVIIKKSGFYAGLFFLGLSLFTFLMASQHNNIVSQSSEAIIFAPTITIQSEPNENAEKLFTLHEGTKVTLLEENNDWSKIKLPNGNVGWIKSDDIKTI
ncbi:MAG: tetratricopeptide repeat protein [Flavobacteriales bacterium]|nr:tetratricopeptide repeat protein [Flavobacteriales bacterium]